MVGWIGLVVGWMGMVDGLMGLVGGCIGLSRVLLGGWICLVGGWTGWLHVVVLDQVNDLRCLCREVNDLCTLILCFLYLVHRPKIEQVIIVDALCGEGCVWL